MLVGQIVPTIEDSTKLEQQTEERENTDRAQTPIVIEKIIDYIKLHDERKPPPRAKNQRSNRKESG